MRLAKLVALLLLAASFAAISRAGPADFRATREVVSPASDTRFERHRFELSLMTGALFSPADLGENLFPRNKTNFDYTQTELRAGLMLHSPWEAGLLRGNFELLVGLGGGAVIHGPGTGVANADLFVRYNFVQARALVVPYWQLGVGLFVSDVARDQSQRIIGRTVEFVVQSGFGLRFLVDPAWSIDLEGVYEHVSNADTSSRNVGVNAFGALLGATYSY